MPDVTGAWGRGSEDYETPHTDPTTAPTAKEIRKQAKKARKAIMKARKWINIYGSPQNNLEHPNYLIAMRWIQYTLDRIVDIEEEPEWQK
jgi:hypothetical protein